MSRTPTTKAEDLISKADNHSSGTGLMCGPTSGWGQTAPAQYETAQNTQKRAKYSQKGNGPNQLVQAGPVNLRGDL